MYRDKDAIKAYKRVIELKPDHFLAVVVWVSVDETGKVISASAVSGHPLLRATALQAARLAEFSPTMLNGKAIRITGLIVYNFLAP